MRITVLGAAGGAGQAITSELAARGHDVVAASRSAAAHDWPAGVTARPTSPTLLPPPPPLRTPGW